MSTMRVSRVLAATAGLVLALFLYSCAFTSDLSGSLVGKVRVAGSATPISSAVVECEGITAISAADGAYSLEGISPGDRAVFASATGYDSYSEVVTVEESTFHDIYMDVFVGPARLFGHVSHATLGPLEGAEVKIGDLTVVTDSLGYYEYPNLEQTSYFMTVTKDSYRSFSQNVRPTSEDYQFDVGLKKLGQVTLWSAADAAVVLNSGMNYGDEIELNLFNDVSHHERFYIQFPLDSIEETAEPSVATLRLYSIWEESTEEPSVILVAGVLQAWGEYSVTWAIGPQTTGASIAQSTYSDRWYEIQVTTYFRDWLVDEDENFGILVDTPVDHLADRFAFASREYEAEDKRAHVVLEYAW
ncbi:MAG: DNRLRE domain-containing protein [Candidatus Eisenbacteria bacterium]